MAQRAPQQHIGSKGHRWLMYEISSHPEWIARGLDEDFGVDIEAELAEDEVRGEILKIQIKSVDGAERKDGRVKLTIDKKYIEYAESCRYPVILVLVDVQVQQAWYLWVQDWLLKRRGAMGELDPNQKSWAEWLPDSRTIQAGLSGELKSIASWKGETQLTLSLIDALRAACATHNQKTIEALTRIIDSNAPLIADVSLDALIDEAVVLGDRMRATAEGNAIAAHLFSLVRKYGNRISRKTVHDMVIRGDTYSRTGLTALGILYDDFFEHMTALGLPHHFEGTEPRVAFYCAYREAHPDEKSMMPDPRYAGFEYSGLRFTPTDRFMDNYVNRGPSAILDHLELAD